MTGTFCDWEDIKKCEIGRLREEEDEEKEVGG
jgi:hypothetical protein